MPGLTVSSTMSLIQHARDITECKGKRSGLLAAVLLDLDTEFWSCLGRNKRFFKTFESVAALGTREANASSDFQPSVRCGSSYRDKQESAWRHRRATLKSQLFAGLSPTAGEGSCTCCSAPGLAAPTRSAASLSQDSTHRVKTALTRWSGSLESPPTAQL